MRETVSNRAKSSANTEEAAPPVVYEEDGGVPQRPPPMDTQSPQSSVDTTTAANSGAPGRQQPVKRPFTLDLNAKPSADGGPKRLRFNPSLNVAPVSVLNSPDLQMLKMASPELEKFMMANPPLQTPTPSLGFPLKVTSEQEDYAKGFVDALNSLRNTETSQKQQATGLPAPPVVTNDTAVNAATAPTVAPVSSNNAVAAPPSTNILSGVGLSGATITYTNLDSSGASVYSNISIKDEPQTVPSPPPHSPIDMDDQERIKLERKRQRNRVAASKCRKRKLERISKLEDKVKNLKGDNSDLGILVKQLKTHVFTLKQEVIDHIKTGCNIPVSYLKANGTAGGGNGHSLNESDLK